MEEVTRNAAILYTHAMDRYEVMRLEHVLSDGLPIVRALKKATANFERATANFERAIAAEQQSAIDEFRRVQRGVAEEYEETEARWAKERSDALHAAASPASQDKETSSAMHDRFVAAQEEWNLR